MICFHHGSPQGLRVGWRRGSGDVLVEIGGDRRRRSGRAGGGDGVVPGPRVRDHHPHLFVLPALDVAVLAVLLAAARTQTHQELQFEEVNLDSNQP